jgi:hypothetical protein
MVARQQLRQDAKSVIAREQQMSQEPPTPRTSCGVAVQMVGTSDDRAPLQSALSDMIITDLSVSPAITSVERVKVSAMIDEMLLSQAGLADQNTGARVDTCSKPSTSCRAYWRKAVRKNCAWMQPVLNTARNQPAGVLVRTRHRRHFRSREGHRIRHLQFGRCDTD